MDDDGSPDGRYLPLTGRTKVKVVIVTEVLRFSEVNETVNESGCCDLLLGWLCWLEIRLVFFECEEGRFEPIGLLIIRISQY